MTSVGFSSLIKTFQNSCSDTSLKSYNFAQCHPVSGFQGLILCVLSFVGVVG